jgi:8-oxo-dGTP diphosphatase
VQPVPVLLAVDTVLFGYTPEHDLQILLIKRGIEPFADSWALPGGFVRPGESLESAVYRELKEEAGIVPDYLEQLYSFGEPGRDPRGRVVTVAYYGLARPSKFETIAGTDATDVRWWAVKSLPETAFDHADIIQTAIKRLVSKAMYEPIGFDLLDEKFPFSHLEHLYSTLLGIDIKSFERRNFRKKILQYGFVEELPEKMFRKGSGRPGSLFRFNRARYEALKKQGIYFEL